MTDGTLTDEVQASPMPASTFKTEEHEELADALMPIRAELELSKAWWILEVIPLRQHAQYRHDTSWVPYWMYVHLTMFCARSLSLMRGLCDCSEQGELGPPTSDSQAGS